MKSTFEMLNIWMLFFLISAFFEFKWNCLLFCSVEVVKYLKQHHFSNCFLIFNEKYRKTALVTSKLCAPECFVTSCEADFKTLINPVVIRMAPRSPGHQIFYLKPCIITLRDEAHGNATDTNCNNQPNDRVCYTRISQFQKRFFN